MRWKKGGDDALSWIRNEVKTGCYLSKGSTRMEN